MMGLSKNILRHIFFLVMFNGLALNMELIRISDGVHVQSNELRSFNTLKRIQAIGLESPVKVIPARSPLPLKTEWVSTAYQKAKGNRLIVADYDGTLSQFFDEPEDAIPSPDLMDALKVLTSDPRNSVWLVSGRDHKFLDKHFGFIENLGLASEYGTTLVYPGGEKHVYTSSSATGKGLQEIEELMGASAKTIPTSTVEKKPFGRVWHYRVPYTDVKRDKVASQIIREKCIQEAENLQLQLRAFIKKNDLPYEVAPGSLVVEVKPNDRDKGKTLHTIYEQFPTRPDFVLIAGDSGADEKMFEVGNMIDSQARKARRYTSKIYTLKVTHKEEGKTSAKYALNDPDEVVQLLRNLAKHTSNQL